MGQNTQLDSTEIANSRLAHPPSSQHHNVSMRQTRKQYGSEEVEMAQTKAKLCKNVC